jgi:hypothetical protein
LCRRVITLEYPPDLFCPEAKDLLQQIFNPDPELRIGTGLCLLCTQIFLGTLYIIITLVLSPHREPTGDQGARVVQGYVLLTLPPLLTLILIFLLPCWQLFKSLLTLPMLIQEYDWDELAALEMTPPYVPDNRTGKSNNPYSPRVITLIALE